MRIQGAVARGTGVALAVLLSAITTGCAGGARPAHAPGAEMVEIGYGSQERRDVTGAVGSITREDVRENEGMRLVEVLATRVPGVHVQRRPNGELSIRIRGASRGMQGEPLVVVDGSPIASHRLMSIFSSIATHQVARIDVLKDAGSTAAYGIRGGNGVILITTRRGT